VIRMTRRVLRVGRSTLNRIRPEVCVTLWADRDNRLTRDSARTWARSLARHGGDINSEQIVRVKGLPGYAWWFSCTGRGGYVLVVHDFADVPRRLDRFAADGAPCWQHPSYPFAAYRFEEDCDWAVFEALFPAVAQQQRRDPAVIDQSLRAWQLLDVLAALGVAPAGDGR
jgi:hypothetical protein